MMAKMYYEAQIKKLEKDLDEKRKLLDVGTAYLAIMKKEEKNR